MDACSEFRGRLAELLAGASAAERCVLSWHEHLASCESCRALLAAEEALEELLDTLPSPRLPRALAERVLARLQADRRDELRLDALLALDAVAVVAPPDLAANVLAGIRAGAPASARGPEGVGSAGSAGSASSASSIDEDALDRLLARVPTPVAPDSLASRVLLALEAERAPAASRPRPLLRFGSARPGFLAAAVLAVVAGATVWLAQPDRRPAVGFALGEEPTLEFLELMPLLEKFELLRDADLGLLLASASIEPHDEFVAATDGWRANR